MLENLLNSISDNPAYLAAAKVVSATTNIPLDRVLLKYENLEGALYEEND